MLLLLFVFLATTGTPGLTAPINDPSPLWDDDILIWDMSENSTWAGPGLTYCNGIFGPLDIQYASAITDSTGAGSILKLFSSEDGGYIWSKEIFITGGSWFLTDPEIALSAGIPAEYIFILYTVSKPTVAKPQGIRFTVPDFQFDGFLEPDWPASDTLLSLEVVCHPETGELWVFGDDSDHNINLSRSTDNGDNWTVAELVATDAILPSAAPGPAGWVYLTYRRVSDNKIMSIAFSESSYYETEVTDGGNTSAPIVASEQSGTSDDLSIIYHDVNFDIRMAMSIDHGATWSISSAISKGYYPFIDVYRQSKHAALAFVDFTTENIYYASAANIADLATVSPILISNEPVFLGGPPVIRYGGLGSEVALFYMGPGSGGSAPQDLWYDNSLHTQSNPEAGNVEKYGLTAGPNPFTNRFTVEFRFDTPSECSLDIYSMNGRLVESVYNGITDGETLNTGEALPTGVYSVVLRTGDSITTRRVVKL